LSTVGFKEDSSPVQQEHTQQHTQSQKTAGPILYKKDLQGLLENIRAKNSPNLPSSNIDHIDLSFTGKTGPAHGF